jgi:hypothetical protein
MEVNMSDELTREEIIEIARELATPIDFDELIAKGILIHRSAQWYEVINLGALPSHARHQASEAKQDHNGKVFFRFPSGWKQAQQFYKKLTGKNYDED